MSNDYTWRQEIEVGGFAGVKPFLANLAEDHNCSLKVLKDDPTFWKDRLIVEFRGTLENLTTLKDEFILSMIKYNLPSTVKTETYKIKAIEEKESNYSREIIFEVNSSKSTKIKELAEAVAEELWMVSKVSEKNNGFLKGKTVQVAALGDRDKLEKFRKIFLNVISDSIEKQNKKPKLRM
jgi:hypothetical protein